MIGIAKKRQIPIMPQRYENFMKTKVAGIALVLILSTETCQCPYIQMSAPGPKLGSGTKPNIL